jgi:uncharacterized protein
MMPTNELGAAGAAEDRSRPVQIASWIHLAGFVLISVCVAASGALLQQSGGSAADGQLASHTIVIHVYLVTIFMEWALFYYCWAGVHRQGSSLWSLAGGRWTSWKSVAIDIGIVVPFWAIWTGAAFATHRLLGPSAAKTVDSLLPKSLLEVVLWIATSITAGICEEIVFRGYLMRQFHALGGSIVLAIAGQGVVFGLFHWYQGWKSVVVISVLGILYGMLAVWRRNLRANIVAHAWTDVWEGWLKFVIFK